MPRTIDRLAQMSRVHSELKRFRISTVSGLESEVRELTAERDELVDLLGRAAPGDVALARLAIRQLVSRERRIKLVQGQLEGAQRAVIEAAIDHHAAQRLVELRRTAYDKKKAIADIEDIMCSALASGRSSSGQGSS